MAPAKTGRDSNSNTAVSKTLQTNKGIISMDIPRIFIIVVMKLIEPKILLTPAMWREKIPRSTAAPECPTTDRGG